MDSPICHMGDGAVNEGERNPDHSRSSSLILILVLHASTKGPGTNPGHVTPPYRKNRIISMPQRRDRGQIPVTAADQVSIVDVTDAPQRRDQEQIPVTSSSAWDMIALSVTPQRRDQEQIPVTCITELTAWEISQAPQRRDQEQIPVTKKAAQHRNIHHGSLNEGTRNKSRSLQLGRVVVAELAGASTKGPGTNPGHSAGRTS